MTGSGERDCVLSRCQSCPLYAKTIHTRTMPSPVLEEIFHIFIFFIHRLVFLHYQVKQRYEYEASNYVSLNYWRKNIASICTQVLWKDSLPQRYKKSKGAPEQKHFLIARSCAEKHKGKPLQRTRRPVTGRAG